MRTKGAARCRCKTTPDYLWKVVVTGGSSRGLEKPKITAAFSKGKQKDPGKYGPVSITLIPVEVIEQVPLVIISKHFIVFWTFSSPL